MELTKPVLWLIDGNDVTRYRAHATWLRSQARLAPKGPARDPLLLAADRWDQMAIRSERAASPRRRRPPAVAKEPMVPAEVPKDPPKDSIVPTE